MRCIFVAVFLFLFCSSSVLADGNTSSISGIRTTPVEKSDSIDPTSKINTLNDINSSFLSEFGDNLFWAFFGALIGSLIAFMAEKYREPKLTITAEEEANSDNTYPAGHGRAGQRWKFFRVKVKNEPQIKILSKLITRATAQQVNAKIRIVNLSQTFKGRWASTLELVNASPLDIARIINFPDPITLIAGENEFLDVFTKYEHDTEAYGWNNEAYLHNWKTPHYRMDPGDYEIEIQVIALSGAQKKKRFKAHIATTIDDTYIKELN